MKHLIRLNQKLLENIWFENIWLENIWFDMIKIWLWPIWSLDYKIDCLKNKQMKLTDFFACWYLFM